MIDCRHADQATGFISQRRDRELDRDVVPCVFELCSRSSGWRNRAVWRNARGARDVPTSNSSKT
jgi:hypothetical protein